MSPKQFLTIGGIVLVLVGILGFVGVIGPTPADSMFGDSWWFDNGENWAHLILGVVGLIAAYSLQPAMQKTLVMLLGILGIFVGLYGFFSANFLGANLENPADNILHIAIGIWAFLSMNTKAQA